MSDLFQSKFHVDKDYLDNLATNGYYDYFSHPAFSLPLNYICDWMDSISPSCSLLEIGSGMAPILKFLGDKHPYIGIDLSAAYIDMCRTKWHGSKNAHFVQADLATYFDSPSLATRGDVLYDGNVFWYFNRDKIADYIDRAMRRIRAKYFVAMEVNTFFPFPECPFLKLVQAGDFMIELSSIPEFKRQRTIEIYERI